MTITDLFRPKWKHSHSAVRMSAVADLVDESVLGDITQHDADHSVRAAASRKLAEMLRAAIKLGDSVKAISLLGIPGDHYFDPDNNGWTPLHFAAFKGDLEVLELLLSKGVPTDCRDKRNKWTPLHYAAAHGHSRLVAPLIKAGADPNAISGPDCNTPLHIAVAMVYPPGYFASHQGETDFIGSQADLQKVLQGHPETASELLKHGADPNKPSGQGRLPLHLVAEIGDIACAEILIERGADLNARGAQQSTALHWAAAKGCEELSKLLLTHGADVNAADALGWTPVFLASAEGFDSVVKLLLEHGANTTATVNGKDVTLATGTNLNEKLTHAVEDGNFDAAKSAIDAGADVNCKFRDGWSPLLSASKEYSKIVELLLANGADSNIPSDRGYTPLMRAAGNGSAEIVRMLLAAGANVDMRDCNGKSASQLANEMGNPCARACALIVNEAAKAPSNRPSNRIPLGNHAAVMVFAPWSSQSYHLVCVEFEDGTALKDAKVFDLSELEVPESCLNKKIAKLSVNLRQP